MIELVTFLGNPGAEYARTRHNTPWLFARELPFFQALDWRKKYQGRYASLDRAVLDSLPGALPAAPGIEAPESPPPRIHFLMPETYMNCSGDSISAAAVFFKIPPQRILLVHDELELPLGTVSLKFSGGLGGHNGLRSMKARFNTADFWRLRFGIGRPNHDNILSWVLSDFTPPETTQLEPTFAAAAALLTGILIHGPAPFLPEWSKKKIAPNP